MRLNESLLQARGSRLAVWLGIVGIAGVGLAAAWRAILLVVAVALGGCASLPSDVARPISHARTDVAGTALGRTAASSLATARAGESGFRLLPGGEEAFDARIALIRRAEKTLDVQYYLIAGDETGLGFLRELRDAAARGVRVRVLVDDLYAAGQDDLLAAFASRPRVELRLFNPLPVRGGGVMRRVVLSMHEFSRINRRMHNKLLIADGSFAISGGRNIANEYFDRSAESNFIDMDVLSAGPVVGEMAALFDRFWNSDAAYPVAALAKQHGDAATFDARAGTAGNAWVDRDGHVAIDSELGAERMVLVTAPARFLADPPPQADGTAATGTVADAHLEFVRSARGSVQLASPYFIPGRRAMAALAEVRARDVDVSVLTNSLATTDEPLVHLGYARHRATLLEVGVSLHELIGVAPTRGGLDFLGAGSGRGGSLGRLHSKLTVVDGERVFIGSMNMDPRSARFNTEAGLVIDSTALASRLTGFLDGNRRDSSYEVRAGGPDRRLSWHVGSGAARRALTSEPGADSRGSLGMRLMALLVDEAML